MAKKYWAGFIIELTKITIPFPLSACFKNGIFNGIAKTRISTGDYAVHPRAIRQLESCFRQALALLEQNKEYCSKCGHEIEVTQTLCEICLGKVEQKGPEKKTYSECQQCGCPLPNGSTESLCTNCWIGD